MASCLTSREIEELLRGTLPADQCLRVEAHLTQCKACADAVRDAQQGACAIRPTLPMNRADQMQDAEGGPGASDSPISSTTPPETTHQHVERGEVRSTPFESIEGYTILNEIHRGGQGVVYKAVQQTTKRVVALKIMLPDSGDSDKHRRRFEREVDLIANLRHSNIVTVFDSGVTSDHRYYFAMAYLHGVPIDTYMMTARPTQVQRLRLFQQICRAVAYAHQKGVIHRDLKPGNIRVDSSGEPHILDFGLAKAAGTDLHHAGPVTIPGEFMGTLAYASPEQAKGDPDLIDTRTDVYSLGIILYEILSGSLPYNVRGPMAVVLRNIAEAPPARLSTRDRRVDKELETITFKALAKDRERRYQSVEMFEQDIGRYLDGQPILARPDSLTYFAGKWLRRFAVHRKSAAVALIVLAAATLSFLLKPHVPASLDQRFDRFAARFVPETWSDDVVVISLNDETYEQLPAIAAELQLPQVRQKSVKSWRSLHGELMRRLAFGAPAAVVWDIKFQSSQPEYDDAFVEGIRALHDKGIKVIVGAAAVDGDGKPRLSPAIAAEIDGWGWIHLRVYDGVVRGPLLAVAHPPRPPTPSLSLAATEVVRFDDWSPSFAWDPDDRLMRVTVRYSRQSPQNPRLIESSSETQVHVASETRRGWTVGVAGGTSCANRYALYYDTLVPSQDVLDQHTVPYEAVLRMNEKELQARFVGKVILIGDNRKKKKKNPDRSVTETRTGEQEQFHAFLHATAISDFLQGRRMRHAIPLFQFCAFLVAAAIGAIAGMLFRVGRLGTLCCLAAIVASPFVAIAAALAVAARYHTLISPSGVAIAMLLALVAAAWVANVRHNHGRRLEHP